MNSYHPYKNITVSGCYNSISGYENLIYTILSGLPEYGFDIRPRTFSNISDRFSSYFESVQYKKEGLDLFIIPPFNEIDIRHPLLLCNTHFNRVIFTMWESTRINDLFIDHLNRCSAVIVPNEWNKQNFINQGCTVPIHVLNLFASDKEYFPMNNATSENFVFGSSNGDPRKRILDTINCFSMAFDRTKKDVRLKIKISPYDKDIKILDDRIEIVKQNFSKEKLNNWYNSIDAYVSCVSAEGWGFMQHEAMMCAKPIIATKYAGLAEYMNFNNSYAVEYSECPSTGFWESPGGKWSLYDKESMIFNMRSCYNERETVKKKGICALETAKILSTDTFLKNLSKILNIYIS